MALGAPPDHPRHPQTQKQAREKSPREKLSNGAPDFRLLHRLLCWRWAGFDARNGIYGKNGPRGVLGWWWLGVQVPVFWDVLS